MIIILISFITGNILLLYEYFEKRKNKKRNITDDEVI